MLMKKILHQSQQQLQVVKQQALHQSGSSTSSKDSNHLLHLAIKNNLFRSVDYLLRTGTVSPNQLALIQSIKQPALCLAARLNFCLIVKMLLSHKAQTNVMDSTRKTPLHLAAKNDCSECIKNLHKSALNSEANFNSNLCQKDADGQTPLILAIRRCKKVTSTNQTDSNTSSVLQETVSKGNAVETLLHLGSDP